MSSLLVKIKRQIDFLKEAGYSQMSENDIKAHEVSYKEILSKGKIECLKKGSKVLSKKQENLLKAIHKDF
jgi:hypothetical protein